MKRKALLTILLVAIFFYQVGLISANPFTPDKDYPVTPDTNPHSISIQLPENKIYTSNMVPYAVSIQEPSFWFNSSAHGGIASVQCIIDGKKTTIDVNDSGKTFFRLHVDPIVNLNGTFSGLNEGNHNVQFLVHSERFYYNQQRNFYGWWQSPPSIFNLDTYSDKLYFTVNTSSKTPTPTTTAPEFFWLVILPLFVFALSVVVIVKLRHRKIANQT
jgi:hypothetical protein